MTPIFAPVDISFSFCNINPPFVPVCPFLYDFGCLSQISVNWNACISLFVASWAADLISTDLKYPVRFSVGDQVRHGDRDSAVPSIFSVLPLSLISLNHTASVLLTLSPIVFSKLTGPDCSARS